MLGCSSTQLNYSCLTRKDFMATRKSDLSSGAAHQDGLSPHLTYGEKEATGKSTVCAIPERNERTVPFFLASSISSL